MGRGLKAAILEFEEYMEILNHELEWLRKRGGWGYRRMNIWTEERSMQWGYDSTPWIRKRAGEVMKERARVWKVLQRLYAKWKQLTGKRWGYVPYKRIGPQ